MKKKKNEKVKLKYNGQKIINENLALMEKMKIFTR